MGIIFGSAATGRSVWSCELEGVLLFLAPRKERKVLRRQKALKGQTDLVSPIGDSETETRPFAFWAPDAWYFWPGAIVFGLGSPWSPVFGQGDHRCSIRLSNRITDMETDVGFVDFFPGLAAPASHAAALNLNDLRGRDLGS